MRTTTHLLHGLGAPPFVESRALTVIPRRPLRRGIELGFLNRRPLIYDGTEPVAIDAQAGKGKLTRFIGVNLVSPRTAHVSKIITDPKDAELAWVSWKTLERQGYKVRFINPARLHGYRSEAFNINTRLLELAANPVLYPIVGEAVIVICRLPGRVRPVEVRYRA